MHCRDENTMKALILNAANKHDRIKAVVMNGSRVSPSAKKDAFQDFDIIYVVTDVGPFVEDQKWLDQFGERLIMQKPDEMSGSWETSKERFAFLIQFKDGNRIDLTLQTIEAYTKGHKDSQSLALLDKDGALNNLPPPSDKDYLQQPPTEKEFSDCCNEFFWVATYAAKGIVRNQLPYAKHMSDQIVKNELIKLMTWYAGIKTDFKVTIGNYAKYLKNYIEDDIWSKFEETYVGTNQQDMWHGLLLMCDLFEAIAIKVSSQYSFYYPKGEYKAVISYLKRVQTGSGKPIIQR